MCESIELRVFKPADQAAVRALVLAGLAEHWGEPADPSCNRDLDDIATSYASGTTLVAVIAARTSDESIVGTGTIVPRADDTAEIVRMSVASEWRGHGIGRKIVEALIDTARIDMAKVDTASVDTARIDTARTDTVRGSPSSGAVHRVILETSATWVESIRFYERCGFVATHHTEGEFGVDVWFERMVSPRSGASGP